MRESNSRQRFWRPLSYHLTNPLYCNSLLSAYYLYHISSIYVNRIFHFFLFFWKISVFSYIIRILKNLRLSLSEPEIPSFIYTFPIFIFLNTPIRTLPIARTRIAAAIASGIPDAVTVPITSPHTALTATSFASAYCFAKRI